MERYITLRYVQSNGRTDMPHPNFTMRFDPEIRKLAEQIADAERRSLTNLIEVAIVEYAEKRKATYPGLKKPGLRSDEP